MFKIHVLLVNYRQQIPKRVCFISQNKKLTGIVPESRQIANM